MECYYVDEVFEQINEEIEFFEEQQKNFGADEKFSYAISILRHMRTKMEKLQVKEFNFSE